MTFEKLDSTSLLAGERVALGLPPDDPQPGQPGPQHPPGLEAAALYRPDVVVSSGAGVAFPFFLLAKLSGKRTVYVEVYDRIDSPTMTGRLCYPFSDLFLLQWEEQRRNYPKGKVIGSLL